MDVNREEISVRDNQAARRYEATVHGRLARLDYRREGDRIILTHAEVPRELEGRGIASTLTQVALDEARAAGLRVVPLCPFVAAYIRRHPAYKDLVEGTAGADSAP